MSSTTNIFKDCIPAKEPDIKVWGIGQVEKPSELSAALQTSPSLLRPDGTPVPSTWTVFTLGELVSIKNYTFKVAYVGETAILLEPVRPEDLIHP